MSDRKIHELQVSISDIERQLNKHKEKSQQQLESLQQTAKDQISRLQKSHSIPTLPVHRL